MKSLINIPEKMKALVLYGVGDLRVTEVDVPKRSTASEIPSFTLSPPDMVIMQNHMTTPASMYTQSSFASLFNIFITSLLLLFKYMSVCLII